MGAVFYLTLFYPYPFITSVRKSQALPIDGGAIIYSFRRNKIIPVVILLNGYFFNPFVKKITHLPKHIYFFCVQCHETAGLFKEKEV